jgi:hypothetical protein
MQERLTQGVSVAQVLSAFATDTSLVLAHVDIAEKSNEIPAAQALLAELGVPRGTIVTLEHKPIAPIRNVFSRRGAM